MAYNKQNFETGQTLTADMLNNIEAGIISIDSATTTINNNISKKQDLLVSGTNIKTINGKSLLGNGNIAVAGGLKLYGKKVMFFGDSITAQPEFYRNNLVSLTGINTVANFAISGATLRDPASGVLDGNPSYGTNSFVANQVQKLLNTVSSYSTPDIIIIAAGINDSTTASESPTYVEAQFTSDQINYVDVDTCDRTTFTGAIRWIYEKLRTVYPDAMIVFCTPLQTGFNSVSRGYVITKIKRDVIISTCNRMSVPYIDNFMESGIYGRYEVSGSNGKYLKDGIHPNAAGSLILAKCIARHLEDLLAMEEPGAAAPDNGGDSGDSGGTGGDSGDSGGTGGDSGDSGGTGGDSGSTGDLTLNVVGANDVGASFAMVAKDGEAYTIKEFKPEFTGTDGEINWVYCSLASPLSAASAESSIAMTQISSGSIKPGESVSDFLLDDTHVLVFKQSTTTSKLRFNNETTTRPFGLTSVNSLVTSLTVKTLFISRYVFAGSYIYTKN